MVRITVHEGFDAAAVERSIEIYNEVHPRDPVGLAEIRSYANACLHYVDVLAYAEGEPAGGGHAAIEGDSPQEARIDVYVLPSRRQRGAGSAVLRALSQWAAEHSAAGLRTGVDAGDADSLAWAERRGFHEFSRETILELDLRAADAPAVEPPPGIEIVSWEERPELAAAIYEVAREAWPDIPGSAVERIEPFDEWLHAHMRGEGDRPEATFLALADGEVVGYSKFSIPSAQPGVAWHDLTGVKRAWRGRGIARALKAAQIAWAKRQGYERLRTMNEERNAPIQRLNTAFGYRPAGGRVRLRAPLLGA